MFDIERWQEIFEAISKNKLRTFLTGISVASGIFILVILLGFGQGMRNGIAHEFEEDAATSVWVWPGETTVAYKGLNPGRNVQLRNDDFDQVSQLFSKDIEYMAAFLFIRGVTVVYKNEVLAIKESLLQFDPESNAPFVEVEVASQTFEKKEIVLGVSDGIFVEVKEGLKLEDKIKVWNALKAVSASE